LSDERINLKGSDKAEVLAALYNSARPLGIGRLHYDPTPMKRDEAEPIIAENGYYFDYLKGRVMKVDLSGDDFDPRLYDRDNGPGTARKALSDIVLPNPKGE